MRSYERGFAGHPRIWVVAVLVAVVFTVLGTPRTAWAHNALVSTTPANGSAVATPPEAVVLTFNEPAIATGTMVLVTGPDGSATQGAPELVDNTVRQDLKQALPAGTYTVEWRVTSADGHPVNGTFTFRARVGARVQTNSETPAPTATASATGPASSAAPASPEATPSTAAAEPGADSGVSSAWWWLLAIVPVGLAAVLGWRFGRRSGG